MMEYQELANIVLWTNISKWHKTKLNRLKRRLNLNFSRISFKAN